jgi:hypothetical protein
VCVCVCVCVSAAWSRIAKTPFRLTRRRARRREMFSGCGRKATLEQEETLDDCVNGMLLRDVALGTQGNNDEPVHTHTQTRLDHRDASPDQVSRPENTAVLKKGTRKKKVSFVSQLSATTSGSSTNTTKQQRRRVSVVSDRLLPPQHANHPSTVGARAKAKPNASKRVQKPKCLPETRKVCKTHTLGTTQPTQTTQTTQPTQTTQTTQPTQTTQTTQPTQTTQTTQPTQPTQPATLVQNVTGGTIKTQLKQPCDSEESDSLEEEVCSDNVQSSDRTEEDTDSTEASKSEVDSESEIASESEEVSDSTGNTEISDNSEDTPNQNEKSRVERVRALEEMGTSQPPKSGSTRKTTSAKTQKQAIVHKRVSCTNTSIPSPAASTSKNDTVHATHAPHSNTRETLVGQQDVQEASVNLRLRTPQCDTGSTTTLDHKGVGQMHPMACAERSSCAQYETLLRSTNAVLRKIHLKLKAMEQTQTLLLESHTQLEETVRARFARPRVQTTTMRPLSQKHKTTRRLRNISVEAESAHGTLKKKKKRKKAPNAQRVQQGNTKTAKSEISCVIYSEF